MQNHMFFVFEMQKRHKIIIAFAVNQRYLRTFVRNYVNFIEEYIMFEKVIIERFRGIRYACIEDFKQINLFFGKNNCGKSSLLESLFLASGLSNPLLNAHTKTW